MLLHFLTFSQLVHIELFTLFVNYLFHFWELVHVPMCTNERSFDDALGAAMDLPARGRIRGALWHLMHYCIKHHGSMHYGIMHYCIKHYCIKHHGSMHYGIMHYCIKHYGANALWHAAAKSTCYVQVYAQYMMCHLSKYNKSHQNLNDMSVIWGCTKKCAV